MGFNVRGLRTVNGAFKMIELVRLWHLRVYWKLLVDFGDCDLPDSKSWKRLQQCCSFLWILPRPSVAGSRYHSCLVDHSSRHDDWHPLRRWNCMENCKFYFNLVSLTFSNSWDSFLDLIPYRWFRLKLKLCNFTPTSCCTIFNQFLRMQSFAKRLHNCCRMHCWVWQEHVCTLRLVDCVSTIIWELRVTDMQLQWLLQALQL